MLEKTFRPEEVEARQYQSWEGSGDFAADVTSNQQPFTIMMPPPNVTGSLHMGHALNTTLQDVLIRWRRMRGQDSLWMPGTDHAGIATQIVVEKQLAQQGKTRHDLGREKFVERVWEWKGESGGTITRQLRRLGASPDWARERFTMDEGLSRAVTRVFVELHRQGLIYRGKRLVNWDPVMHTAISDLEVENRDHSGNLWHIRYPVDGQKDRFITVATTRPETMLGDVAVAVNPEDERYKDLVGKHAILPLVGRKLKIIADEWADPEVGSGAVKITPAHDFNDFNVGERHGLELINIFDADARLNDNAPDSLRGLDRFDARKKIVAALEAAGLLEKVEPHQHMLPHGERSGAVVEPWLTDQWFCDAPRLAGPAIRAVEMGETVFVPRQWENTYYEWMRNIQPWCISRQIWWGHRIPAWYGPDEEIFVAETEADALSAARAHYGKDVTLTQDPDVLDTWFSSALWPFSTLGWPDQTPELARYYPGDVLVTGFDIIFFWVARMMMMGLHFMGEVPFRTVYIHALVRDEQGQKMSKSKGNIIDPLDLSDKYGADALRFTLAAMASPGRDIKLSESRVEGYRNFCTKLWNAARFAQANDCRPVAEFHPTSLENPLNRWIVSEQEKTLRAADKALADFRFDEAAATLYHFAWGTFCDWYLELAKPLLQGEASAGARAETQATTAWVLDRLLLLLHPFIPYLTEELFASIGQRGKQKMIRAEWPRHDDQLLAPAAEAEINWVIALVTAVRSLRSDMNVPAAAKIRLLVKDAGPDARARIALHQDLICRLARLEVAECLSGPAPKGAVQTVLPSGETLLLPLAGIIDLDQERARLEKEITRLQADIDQIARKLENQNFVARAPEEVVEEQRRRREAAEVARAKLAGALAALVSAA